MWSVDYFIFLVCGCLGTSFSGVSFFCLLLLVVQPYLLLWLLVWWVGLLVFYAVDPTKVSTQTSFLSSFLFRLFIQVTDGIFTFGLSMSIQHLSLSACQSNHLTFTFGFSLRVILWLSFLCFLCLCLLIPRRYSLSLLAWVHPSTSHRAWEAPECLFHPGDTAQACGLWVTHEGVPCLVWICHISHIFSPFVSFALLIMVSLPSVIKESQTRVLKTLLVMYDLKVKTHDQDQFCEEASILFPLDIIRKHMGPWILDWCSLPCLQVWGRVWDYLSSPPPLFFCSHPPFSHHQY